MEKSNEQLTLTISKLESIEKILSKVNEIKDNSNTDLFPDLYLYHLSERFEESIPTLKVLLKDNAVSHYHTIGLLLRSILTDSIDNYYLISMSNSKEEHAEKIKILFKTDLVKFKTHVESHPVYIADKRYKENFEKRLANEKDPLYHINKYDLKDPEKKYTKTTTQIWNYFRSNKDKIEEYTFNILIEAYDLWALFSKFEHSGWFSYEFTRNINTTTIILQVNIVLKMAIICNASYLELLGKTKEGILLFNILKSPNIEGFSNQNTN